MYLGIRDNIYINWQYNNTYNDYAYNNFTYNDNT
jgi:hypothetical protein